MDYSNLHFTKIGTLTKMFLHVKNILVNAKRLTRLVSHDVIRA